MRDTLIILAALLVIVAILLTPIIFWMQAVDKAWMESCLKAQFTQEQCNVISDLPRKR